MELSSELKRRKAKHRIVNDPDWKNGTLQKVLGVSDARDLRKQHIDDYYILYPEERIIDMFDYPWKPMDLRRIRALMSLQNLFFPF